MTGQPSISSLLQPPASFSVPKASIAPTPDIIGKLKKLEEHFGKEGFGMAIKEGSMEKAKLGDMEMMYLSRETFLRFLTGTEGDVTAAITRLEACLVWRRTENIDNLERMAEDCEPESRTGKNMVLGFTPKSQPIIYFFPNRNTTPVEKRRAVHAVFMLERARDLMPENISNVLVVFNFSGARQGPPTSVSVARQTLYILSAYYPETLSLCIFQNVPWIVKTFVNLMWPFVDPVTKKKVKFGTAGGRESILEGDLDAGQLLKECGGDLDIPYDHEKYWPELIRVCEDKRKEQFERFLALGPKVGMEEREWKHTKSEPRGTAQNEKYTSLPGERVEQSQSQGMMEA